MDCSTPGFPVLHHLLELAQTHVHRAGDPIQPSHLLLSSSPAFNLSQHLNLFQWVSFLHQVAKVLKFQVQHQSFQWILRTDLRWTGWISLRCKGLSRVFSNTTVQKHHSSALSLLCGSTLISIHDYWELWLSFGDNVLHNYPTISIKILTLVQSTKLI